MIFLRHPRPQVAPGTCYGRDDVAPGPTLGAEVAAALRATPTIAQVVASPALRCRHLAVRLAAREDVPLRFDARLWELDFGAWEGQRWDELPRAELDAWAADPWHVPPPGGERFADLHARVAAALGELAPGTGVVAHAGPIRAARMILTGAAFDAVFAEPVPYAVPLSFSASTEAP